MSNEEIETCNDCEYLLSQERNDMQLPETANEFYCSHYDLFEPGRNEPENCEWSNFIGFLPVCPDWCPLKAIRKINSWYEEKCKGPKMTHYMVVKWLENLETGKREYQIILYCEKFEEYEENLKLYPESDGYIHVMSVGWLMSHNIIQRVKEIREKEKLRLETEKR